MPGFEVFGEEERKSIQDVLDSGVLMRYNFEERRNGHWKAKEFEKSIEQKFNIPYAHLTSSGTTALITALKSLGIGAYDEVIMPSFTFVATFEAILFTGAIPVIVDIDETLTLSPAAVESAITNRTKAIMPVHMCGAMADLNPLLDLAKENKLFLIEDACQSIGATYHGKHLGTIGDIGCLSFDAVKTVTCGEGGAVLTNFKEFYEIAEQYSDHGHDHIGNNRGLEDHPIPGINFRINELNAAVGLAQFQKLDDMLNRQRSIKNTLKSLLAEIPEIRFRKIPDEKGDNAAFLSFFMEDEDSARRTARKMLKSGIPNAYWFDNKWHYYRKWTHFMQLKNDTSLYKEQRELLPDYANQDFSQSDAIMKKTISIPISLKWTEKDIHRIAENMLKIVESQKSLNA